MAASRKTAVKLDETVYTEALRVWMETGSKSEVCCETGLKRKQVAQLLDEGIPDLGLPPFKGQDQSQDGAPTATRKRKPAAPPLATAEDKRRHHAAKQAAKQQIAAMKASIAELDEATEDAALKRELALQKEELDQTAVALDQAEKKLELEQEKIDQVTDRALKADLIEVSATETALARSAMQSSMNVAAMLEYMTEKLLTSVIEGRTTLPSHLDMKTLKALTAATEKATATMERAIKIDKGRAGETDKDNDAYQISVILSSCTPEEIDEITKNGGLLPQRVRDLVTPTQLEEK